MPLPLSLNCLPLCVPEGILILAFPPSIVGISKEVPKAASAKEIGNSKKRFIKELSKKNDTKNRTGGTVASSIFLMMQGVQILRIHEVNETLQGIKIFKKLLVN